MISKNLILSKEFLNLRTFPTRLFSILLFLNEDTCNKYQSQNAYSSTQIEQKHMRIPYGESILPDALAATRPAASSSPCKTKHCMAWHIPIELEATMAVGKKQVYGAKTM